MKIARIMSANPQTVLAGDELDRAMQLMDEHDLRHLPVLEEGRLVGVVSDRDLLEATGWIAAGRRRVQLERSGEGPSRTISTIMHSPAVTIAPDDTIFTAAVLLVTHRIGCLPVVDSDELVGIVTERDLLGAYEDACQDESQMCDDPRVSGPMTTPPLTVSWDTGLDEAIELCRNAGVRHLPVCEGDRLVGMVSDRDLRRAHGRGRVDETMMEEIMTKDVICISPEDHLHDAARIMRTCRIGGLPVVTNDVVLGIVSSTDLVYHCMQNLREPEQTT